MAKARRRGYVPVQLGGRTRVLHYDVNALVLLEERMGTSILNVLRGLTGIRAVRECLYAGLVHAEPLLTPIEVGNMMKPAEIGVYGAAIAEAMGAALGSDKEGKEDGGNEENPTEPESGA